MALTREIVPMQVSHGAKPVGATAVLIAAARDRAAITIQNKGAAAVVVGGSGVTTASGIEIAAGATLTLETGAAIYGIAASGTNDVRYLESHY